MTCPTAPRRFRRLRAFALGRKGAAAIEFALVAPTLFGVVLGVLEVGLYSWYQHSLEFATEETARVVMTKTAVTESEVSTAIKGRISGLSEEDLTTTVTQETIGTTTFVTMSVSYTYNFLLVGNLFGLEPMLLKSQTRVPLRTAL
jgi:Flp pilus assembly protein TadG